MYCENGQPTEIHVVCRKDTKLMAQINSTKQRILTARRQGSWLCTSEVQKLNQGLCEINPCGICQLGLVAWICQGWGAETGHQ